VDETWNITLVTVPQSNITQRIGGGGRPQSPSGAPSNGDNVVENRLVLLPFCSFGHLSRTEFLNFEITDMNRCPGSYTGSTSNDVPFEHGIWSGTYGLAAMTPESGIFTLKVVGECMPVLQLNVTRE